MSSIRPFRGEDAEALAEICLITADNGTDATGLLPDDTLWADIFLRPYLRYAPDLAFVLEVDGAASGYVIGAADTSEFDAWFRQHWWPGRPWPRSGGLGPDPSPDLERQSSLLALAERIGADGDPGSPDPIDVVAYPAHLHIDLHPRAQGRGGGRALIETFTSALRARAVAGVHLTASGTNAGALAFYPRVGFAEIARSGGSVSFGMSLRP